VTKERAPGARIAFAGGGTGGHLTPGLHLLDQLVSDAADGSALPPADLLWFVSGRAVETLVLAGLEAQVSPCAVDGQALVLEPPGGGAPSLARLARHAAPATLVARRALRAHRSDCLLGLGGFTSLPAVLAARSLRIPVYLLEVNAVAGRATRWLSPFATRVFHAFPSSLPASKGERDQLSGAPLPPRRAWQLDREEERRKWGVAGEEPLLAVLGGSQGAQGLNDFMRSAAPLLASRGIKVRHQVGPGRMAEGADPVDGYRALEYIEHVPSLLAAADFVLSRGGAFTLAEVAAAGVPAWVVPYPHHVDRHQARNAMAFGAGFEIIQEEGLSEERALELTDLMGPSGQERRDQMRSTLAALQRPESSRTILQQMAVMPRD
jgi:UDP-N-acetylglucosamine--N-acetylmuramyl-(pentapeptide) pyrophosphoryl-undecaprenol N-acetylglucosamine transferase